MKMNHYEGYFHELLLEVQDETELIPVEIDVVDRYHVSRSFCRGTTAKARIGGVSGTDIELNNRWRVEERQTGKQVNTDMVSLYTQHVMEVKLFINSITHLLTMTPVIRSSASQRESM